MRDWNPYQIDYYYFLFWVLNRTYEGLKSVSYRINDLIRGLFWIEPMRDWNMFIALGNSMSSKFWIEPMRDWNIKNTSASTRTHTVLNRTYEGLKWMIQANITAHIFRFESNLWGIEIQYREWFRSRDSGFWIEPMGDWNGFPAMVCEPVFS